MGCCWSWLAAAKERRIFKVVNVLQRVALPLLDTYSDLAVVIGWLTRDDPDFIVFGIVGGVALGVPLLIQGALNAYLEEKDSKMQTFVLSLCGLYIPSEALKVCSKIWRGDKVNLDQISDDTRMLMIASLMEHLTEASPELLIQGYVALWQYFVKDEMSTSVELCSLMISWFSLSFGMISGLVQISNRSDSVSNSVLTAVCLPYGLSCVLTQFASKAGLILHFGMLGVIPFAVSLVLRWLFGAIHIMRYASEEWLTAAVGTISLSICSLTIEQMTEPTSAFTDYIFGPWALFGFVSQLFDVATSWIVIVCVGPPEGRQGLDEKHALYWGALPLGTSVFLYSLLYCLKLLGITPFPSNSAKLADVQDIHMSTLGAECDDAERGGAERNCMGVTTRASERGADEPGALERGAVERAGFTPIVVGAHQVLE